MANHTGQPSLFRNMSLRLLAGVERTTGFDLLEEVVPLVVYKDECGEILHLNLPDCLHAELRILEQLNILD